MPTPTHQLAQAIADRLVAVLPAGFTIRADGRALRYGSVDHPGEVFELEADIEAAALRWRSALERYIVEILGQVQDAVMVEGRRPWPNSVAAAGQGPEVEIVGRVASLRYGSALRLDAIDLDAIGWPPWRPSQRVEFTITAAEDRAPETADGGVPDSGGAPERPRSSDRPPAWWRNRDVRFDRWQTRGQEDV